MKQVLHVQVTVALEQKGSIKNKEQEQKAFI